MEQTAPRHRQLRVTHCLWCAQLLPDGRADRKTHDECRQKISRWQRRLDRRRIAAIEMILCINEYLGHDLTRLDAIEALKDIRTAVENAYRENRIVRVK